MSISLIGATSSGNLEDQLGSNSSSSLKNNALFSNFSALMTPILSENSDADSSLGHQTFNVHLNKINEGDVGNVSALNFLEQIMSDDLILLDDKLENLISEEGVEGLVSHLENGGNLDGSIQFNATSAFIESRLERLSSEPSVDHNSGRLAFLTVEELFAASEHIYDIGKGLSEQGTLNENAHILNDLMIGMPNQLELNGVDTSSILFDIRDLKNSLIESHIEQSAGVDLANVAYEFLIPQIVPINVENTQINNDTFAPFVAVKVELFGPEGDLETFGPEGDLETFGPEGDLETFGPERDLETFGLEGDLGIIEFSDLPGAQPLGVNSGISGVTRTVDIASDIDPRSKLLIGLSIPENSDFRKLPDFVRLKVALASENDKTKDSGLTPINYIDKPSEVSPLMGINESSDSRDVAKQLILSLQEMSVGSSVGVKIVAKTASVDALIPNIDINGVSISDLEKSSLKLDVKETVSLGEIPKSYSSAQYRAIFDQEVKFAPLLKNDVRSRMASSAISFEENFKNFHKVKESKSAPVSEVFDTKGIDQKSSTLVFNPKSFLEAVEVLKMKPVSFSNGAPKDDQQTTGRFDNVSVTSTKSYNQKSSQSGSSSNPNSFSQSLNNTISLYDAHTKSYNLVSPQSGSSGNPNGFSQSLNNTISLYDAQYSSRISMLVVDKVLNGNENFEIHLEPESFGKIKVNVFIDKQALDIRMFAETQSAAILLRAGEESLLQITNQNGMKLSSFSVGMQSGADQQKQSPNQDRNRNTSEENGVLKRAGIQNSQTAISYRTPTGLNLIA